MFLIPNSGLQSFLTHKAALSRSNSGGTNLANPISAISVSFLDVERQLAKAHTFTILKMKYSENYVKSQKTKTNSKGSETKSSLGSEFDRFLKKVIFFVEKRGHDSLMISDLTL